MAQNAYLRLIGETQGEIKGSVTKNQKENLIKVSAWKHKVSCLHDEKSGLSTGKREHSPLVITKEIDQTSPLLMKALINNENIPNLELECWRLSDSGKEDQHYTIRLINASISGIKQVMPDNNFPENNDVNEQEHITFYYEQIIWEWIEGSVYSIDNWNSQAE